MMPRPTPVVLCILDGWGLAPDSPGNAPARANTPNIDWIMANCPSAELITHGPDVGLPTGQMGNSEVGHTNIGAGRVVAMDLGQIDLAIETGSFFDNEVLTHSYQDIKAAGGRLHVFGLMSDGGVHSHLDHLIAAVQGGRRAGLEVIVHALTDGRDVAPQSAYGYLAALQERLSPEVRIGTLSGRYFAMDRDKRWERVAEAFDVIVHASGPRAAQAHMAVSAAYNRSETDEFITPTVLGDYAGARDGDGFFCVNFRADRVLEILAAIGDPRFDAFDVGQRPRWSALVGMSEYGPEHNAYMRTAYPKQSIPNTLGDCVSQAGLRQFRVAETEKNPHVTYFLNGGVHPPLPGEDRDKPASPNVATYDLAPEMSAEAVTESLIRAIEQRYDLIVVNYANPDMVGHSGDLHAAIKACEVVDHCLGRALAALKVENGVMVLCADHGNCEVMIDPASGGPHTAHTTNPVPIAVIGAEGNLASGRLADVAPTVLALIGLEAPPEMTGRVLFS